MSDVKKIVMTTNCGACEKKPQVSLQFSFPLDKTHFDIFSAIGFVENKRYTKLGLFNMEHDNAVIIGTLGSNKFIIKCKNSQCNQTIEELEDIIKAL